MSDPRRRPAAVTWLVVLLLAAGCGTTGSGSAASTASTKPIVSPPDESRSVPTPRLAWRPCDADFTCATLRAPLDYAHPTGPTIDVAVARLPARKPAERIG